MSNYHDVYTPQSLSNANEIYTGIAVNLEQRPLAHNARESTYPNIWIQKRQKNLEIFSNSS
jgi:predicted GIY-YIG superfamily endonuclease